MDKEKISLERSMEIKEASKYLEDLAKGLRAGKLLITQGEKSMELNAPENVMVEVEAKQKKGKVKFALELMWQPEMDPSEAIDIKPLEDVSKPKKASDDVKKALDKAPSKKTCAAPAKTPAPKKSAAPKPAAPKPAPPAGKPAAPKATGSK